MKNEYVVVYIYGKATDLLESNTVRPKLVKVFKSLKPALKMAYKRNQMISAQTLGIFNFVYDKTNNQCLRADKN